MNPETSQPVTPPPETPPPPSPGQTRTAGPGLLQRWLDLWCDRDLDTDDRDTSDWNIYYYYFRQIAQHRATFKIKHMKWLALLFQIYFFSMLAVSIERAVRLFLLERSGGTEAGPNLFFGIISMIGVSANIYIMPLFLFLPVFMVAPAFRLRHRAQGFMTSRAKEPPLLAHLTQYTTNHGLVQGALHSMLFAWRRILLLLLPSIAVGLLLLTVFIVLDPTRGLAAAGTLIGQIMLILTLALFVVMQPFCYRLDTLLMVIAVFIEAIQIFFVGLFSTYNGFSIAHFWIALPACFIPSCLFACVYFPLAAADTGDYGLDRRVSKWIRILLFSAAGLFLLLLFGGNAFISGLSVLDQELFRQTTHVDLDEDQFRSFLRFLYIVFIWGLFTCVCGLLVTSLSVTSHKATLVRRSRAGESFLRKLADPASPLSLFPVFALELVSLAVVMFWTRPYFSFSNAGREAMELWVVVSMGFWTVLHFGLVFTFWQRHGKLRTITMRIITPWTFHVLFNMFVLVFTVVFVLLAPLLSIFLVVVGPVLYGFSMLLCCISVMGLFRPDDTAAPGGVPAQGPDKEAV